jgi:hypothetical protein
MTFTKTNTLDWTTNDWITNIKLTIVTNDGTSDPLQIISVEWSINNDYTIIIYTDNPIENLT